MDYKDYYKILGVDKKAADKDIKSAYRKLARRHHPDVNPGDKRSEERFKEIGEAYAVLSDPEKRARYDTLGPNWQQFATSGSRPSGARTTRTTRPGSPFTGTGSPFGQTSETFEYDLGGMGSGGGSGGFSDFFEALFGGATGRRASSARPTPPQNLDETIQVSLAEAYSGTDRRFQIQSQELCPVCHGSGRVGSSPCASCDASGFQPRQKTIEVKIPPGVRTGSRIRVKGEGGITTDGSRGDLYVVVEVQPDSRFEREEDDIRTEVPVDLATALLGGEISVPTPKGTRLSLKIPADTPNDRVFLLRGMGMPHLRGTGSGDLLARVHVVLPKSLTQQEKEVIAGIARRHETGAAAS